MPPLKRGEKDPKEGWTICSSVLLRLLSVLIMVAAPLLLIYINVRCEKNQCVLWQFPLVLPTHLSAYFSVASFVTVLTYLIFMFIVSSVSSWERKKRSKAFVGSAPFSLVCLLSMSVLMLCIAYLKPAYIKAARAEYLRLLCSTVVFSFVFSFIFAILLKFDIIWRERDRCFPMAFIHGYNTRVKVGSVNLKFFFYVHAGLTAWGLIDLLIFINFVLERSITAPVCFIFITQYLLILHTLKYEKFLYDRPFIYTEGLGFFWLMRVLLFVPFFFSLPILYTTATENTFPKPAMLANCALFMFGFVIYISSLHQRENYVANPLPVRSWKSILTNSGKRLLIGGYWGTVQKPDYLGYLMMWLSWVIACGFSAVSFIVMGIIVCTIFYWLHQVAVYHKERYGSAWNRYTFLVPHKIIPFLY